MGTTGSGACCTWQPNKHAAEYPRQLKVDERLNPANPAYFLPADHIGISFPVFARPWPIVLPLGSREDIRSTLQSFDERSGRVMKMLPTARGDRTRALTGWTAPRTTHSRFNPSAFGRIAGSVAAHRTYEEELAASGLDGSRSRMLPAFYNSRRVGT